jgi:hypothetical protein
MLAPNVVEQPLAGSYALIDDDIEAALTSVVRIGNTCSAGRAGIEGA